MKGGFSLSGNQAVARSLRISGATHATVATVSAAVALNGMVAMQFLGSAGQAVLLGVIFATLAAGLAAISVDLYSRSIQTISNLRSIGASRGGISQAVAFSMVVYGGAGAVVGTAAGAGVGAAFGSSGISATSYVVDFVAVLVASSAAIAAGVYAGVRTRWHS